MASFTDRHSFVALAAALLMAALITVGCGTASGSRYDSTPAPSADRLPQHQAAPAPAPAPSRASAPRPRRDASRGIETSLDSAHDWRTEAYLERQQERREARTEAREEARERAHTRSISERRSEQRGLLRSAAYRDRYNGAHGYPYTDRIMIGGVIYRRIWRSSGYFILDGEPTWDGYGFRYAASSGAQVWRNNNPRSQRPTTEYERRIYERRYGQPYSRQPAPQPGGWRAGGMNR